ncbi:MAG TPA: NAD-dependent epimerase/dehydratase family protein, partial [Ignavibacteriales bacterium]|nr:NAD-dependent epimerase/dehydratase family protein [Ignavibacteriales bacterium]
VINGTGKQTRDYVFVKDVVNANLITLDDTASDIYNVGTSKETDVNYLFNTLNEIIGKNYEEKHGPAAPGEQMRSVITSEKMFNKFNWKPSTELKEGLKETVEFFRTDLK